MIMCWGDAGMCFDAFSSAESVLQSNVTALASFKKVSNKIEEIALPDSNQSSAHTITEVYT